jgi:hypothetical protein
MIVVVMTALVLDDIVHRWWIQLAIESVIFALAIPGLWLAFHRDRQEYREREAREAKRRTRP